MTRFVKKEGRIFSLFPMFSKWRGAGGRFDLGRFSSSPGGLRIRTGEPRARPVARPRIMRLRVCLHPPPPARRRRPRFPDLESLRDFQGLRGHARTVMLISALLPLIDHPFTTSPSKIALASGIAIVLVIRWASDFNRVYE
jgi:hypothetical protein